VTQAEALLKGWETEGVMADKGYDSDAVLALIEEMVAEAVIPPKANRVEQRVYDKEFYSANSPPATMPVRCAYVVKTGTAFGGMLFQQTQAI
jgi:hypothetical protein